MANQKVEAIISRQVGLHRIKLDGFAKDRAGWQLRIIRAGNWSGVVGRLYVYGIYGTERVLLRGPVGIGEPSPRGPDGKPSTDCWIAGTWPGVQEGDIRTARIPEDIEAEFVADKEVSGGMELSALTENEFRALRRQVNG